MYGVQLKIVILESRISDLSQSRISGWTVTSYRDFEIVIIIVPLHYLLCCVYYLISLLRCHQSLHKSLYFMDFYLLSIRFVIQQLNVLHYKNDGTASLSFTYRKRQYFAPIILILKALKSECDKYIYDRLMDGKEDDSYYAWYLFDDNWCFGYFFLIIIRL